MTPDRMRCGVSLFQREKKGFLRYFSTTRTRKGMASPSCGGSTEGLRTGHPGNETEEEKAYKCDQCDYATARKSNLDRHRTKHTGDKPYKCDQCDYSAAQKCALVIHVTKHTGEKPYMCGECGY
ncbi:zinc finger and SCAN domain-containing protein 2-like, partial [Branchiostoma floridae]|uniref:Zinc finger and SCAN domain-containing protein 2-like n=1 Tax=Branchiostoma floridae TaxID=7739 RepID=A0A9J7HU71_BRAFL